MDLGSLVKAALAAQVHQASARIRTGITAAVARAVMALVALVFAVLAIVFAALATYHWLTPQMTAPLAALSVAGGLLVLALLAWAVGALMAGRVRKRAAAAPPPPPPPAGGGTGTGGGGTGGGMGGGGTPPSPEAMMMQQGYDIGVALQDTLARHPGRTVALGLAAGLAVSLSPSLRKAFKLDPGDRDRRT